MGAAGWPETGLRKEAERGGTFFWHPQALGSNYCLVKANVSGESAQILVALNPKPYILTPKPETRVAETPVLPMNLQGGATLRSLEAWRPPRSL